MARPSKPDALSAAAFLPKTRSIRSLARAAEDCRGCPLFENATQTVFGRGSSSARLVLVGEQPGDQEDKQGEPFVGPAGRLLDKALEEAGSDRQQTYITNAVKHFKWVPRGKRRLHAKPSSREIKACRPWLDAEIAAIHPDLIVCLGATAAQSLPGPAFRITRQRGQILHDVGEYAMLATYHPSALLRAPDEDALARMRQEFWH